MPQSDPSPPPCGFCRDGQPETEPMIFACECGTATDIEVCANCRTGAAQPRIAVECWNCLREWEVQPRDLHEPDDDYELLPGEHDWPGSNNEGAAWR